MGVPGGDCTGLGKFAPPGCGGRAEGGPGDAAGVVRAPGCVPGDAFGGLFVAAGWFLFSELGPSTAVARGVPLGFGETVGEAAGAFAPVS